MIPTAEELLSNLPMLIVVWTAITLCWGLYVHIALNRLHRQLSDIGIEKENYSTYFTIFANGVLMSFLVLEPMFVDYMDMIIVVNVFYSVYLAYSTIGICRLWKFIHTSPNSPHTLS